MSKRLQDLVHFWGVSGSENSCEIAGCGELADMFVSYYDHKPGGFHTISICGAHYSEMLAMADDRPPDAKEVPDE